MDKNLELIKAKNDTIADLLDFLMKGEGHCLSPGDIALKAIDMMENNIRLRFEPNRMLTTVE